MNTESWSCRTQIIPRTPTSLRQSSALAPYVCCIKQSSSAFPTGGCVCEHTHVFSAWWGLLQPSFCHYSRWVLQRQADPCQVAWLGSLTVGYTFFEGINQGRYFINLWKTPDRKKKSKLFRDYNLSKLLILSHSTTSLDLICSYPSL